MLIVCAGAEGFELDLGPWSVLGNRSLSVDSYVPDFDAVAQPPCRMLRIRRAAYRAALEATTLDPVLGYQVRLHDPDPTASRRNAGSIMPMLLCGCPFLVNKKRRSLPLRQGTSLLLRFSVWPPVVRCNRVFFFE